MLKLLGVTIVSATVALCGFSYYMKLVYRKRYVEGLLKLSETSVQVMRGKGLDVFSILEQNAFYELKFLKRITKSNIINRNEMADVLRSENVDNSDIDLIVAFLQGLGSSDIKGQENHCGYYSVCFRQLLQDVDSIVREKGRLVRTLSILAALALFIIFI
ncbi:MAG: hypothetical protein J6S13_08685 [Clostridia bacterium]|nr:hypothetical protein [Clostridia bacterium]